MSDHRRILMGMATTALIPVSEYLATSYRPDCDYVDGELKERNVGETAHGSVQAFFASIIRQHRKAWQVWVTTEQRVQTSAEHFRVADVCARRLSDPADPILRVPPLLCIEVLSPGDSLRSVQAVVDDYLGMGVQNVWIVDPEDRRAWTADAKALHVQHEAFAIEGTPIRIALADIWAELDELAAGPAGQ